MELVGLGYTGWFVYRYLLYKVRPKIQMFSSMFLIDSKLSSLDFSISVSINELMITTSRD